MKKEYKYLLVFVALRLAQFMLGFGFNLFNGISGNFSWTAYSIIHGLLILAAAIFFIYVIFNYSKNIQYKSYTVTVLIISIMNFLSIFTFRTNVINRSAYVTSVSILQMLVIGLIVFGAVIQYVRAKQLETIYLFMVMIVFNILPRTQWLAYYLFSNLSHDNYSLLQQIIAYSVFGISLYVMYQSLDMSKEDKMVYNNK